MIISEYTHEGRAALQGTCWLPEGHACDRQPVGAGLGGQPQRARAARQYAGGGAARADLRALVAPVARRLGGFWPLQGVWQGLEEQHKLLRLSLLQAPEPFLDAAK